MEREVVESAICCHDERFPDALVLRDPGTANAIVVNQVGERVSAALLPRISKNTSWIDVPCPMPSGCHDKFVFWKSTWDIYKICVFVCVWILKQTGSTNFDNLDIRMFDFIVFASPCPHQQSSGAKGLCCSYAQGEDSLDRVNGFSEGYAFEDLKNHSYRWPSWNHVRSNVLHVLMTCQLSCHVTLFWRNSRSVTMQFLVQEKKGKEPWAYPVVMAAGIGLRETRLCSEESFKALWSKALTHILFECMDDDGGPQGCAVARILERYQCDSDGGFVKLEYLAVQDPYYEHWVSQSGGAIDLHHVCRKSLSTCLRKVGRKPIVHIQKWAFITESEVEACRKEWKVGRLDAPPSGVGRGLKVMKEEMTTASKKKPRRPERSPSPVKAGEDDEERSTDFEEESGSQDVEDRKKKSHGSSRRRKRRSGRHKSSHGGGSKEPLESGRHGPRGDAPKRGDVKASPLDAMLDDDATPDYVKARCKVWGVEENVGGKEEKDFQGERGCRGSAGQACASRRWRRKEEEEKG